MAEKMVPWWPTETDLEWLKVLIEIVALAVRIVEFFRSWHPNPGSAYQPGSIFPELLRN
jgi:hypothetical protein